MRFVAAFVGAAFGSLFSLVPVQAAGPWDLPSGRQASIARGDVELSFHELWGPMLILEFYVPGLPEDAGYGDNVLFWDARSLCERVAIPLARELPDDIAGALVLMKPFDLQRGTYSGAEYSDRLIAYEMPFEGSRCLNPRQ
ncbi:hypothetical protein FJU08_18800 [Martelella alba]|uniref:Uncharacterized protein n=1 Tax=Martelella alba TaxID=2590451 RepID=A0A506U457_9HYPH|nr:hypothetical protein [Martelella alba]TPW28091.1 hypothetical protein FJU08_18800 [Martelella alba]